jgi:hypothetical protein
MLVQGPAHEVAARQMLEKDGQPTGEVALMRYKDQDTLFDAEGEAVFAMPKDNRRGIFTIGDWSYLYTTDEPGKEYSEMVFTRCLFMAYIRIEGVSESDLIIAYGKSLDKRLQEAYCPQSLEGS